MTSFAGGRRDVNRIETMHSWLGRMSEDHEEMVARIRETQVAVNKSINLLNTLAERLPANIDGSRHLDEAEGYTSEASPPLNIPPSKVKNGVVRAPKKEPCAIEEVGGGRMSGRRMSGTSMFGTHGNNGCTNSGRRNSGASILPSEKDCSFSHLPGGKESKYWLCATLPTNWPVSVQLRKGLRGPCSGTGGDIVMSTSENAQDNDYARTSSLRLRLTDEQGGHRFCGPFNPHAKSIVSFDCLGMVILVYDLLSTPVQLAWDLQIVGVQLMMSLISTIYWTLAIGVAVRTGFYERGELKMGTRDVTWNYISKYFTFDFLLVSVDWMSITTNGSDMGDSLKAYRVLRLFKVVRALKIMALFDKLVAYRLGNDSKGLVLVKVGLFTLFFTHIMCCAWYALGNMQANDMNVSWLDAFHGKDTTAYVYLTAYSWVLAQIALGAHDVSPLNSYERVVCILLNVFGLLYSSTIVSIVSAQAMEYVTVRRGRVEDMSRLSSFLDQHKVELRLANRVRRQANDRLKTNEVMLSEDHVKALSLLSADLQLDVLNVVRSPHVVTHPLFQYWARVDVGATRRLCQEAVQFVTLMPQDCAFMPGTSGRECFYITPLKKELTASSLLPNMGGPMTYTQTCETAFVDEEEIVTVKEGTWVSEAALWTEWIHVGKLTAQVACQLLTVDAARLQETLSGFGRVAGLTRMYAREFCLRLRVAAPPFSQWPNDLRIPGADPNVLLSERAYRGLLMGEWNAGRLNCSQEIYEDLLEEVKAEKSAVVSVPGQGLQRVVFVCTLQLQRVDGRMFVQVGKWSEAKGVEPVSAVLPGVKRDRSELPHKALQRLLQNDLAAFHGGIKLSHAAEEAELKESDKYGMMTKYLRTVNFADLKEEFGMPSLSKATLLCQNDDLPEFCNSEVYVVHTRADKADLYTWLHAEDIHLVRGLENDALRSWMRNVDPTSCRFDQEQRSNSNSSNQNRESNERWWQVRMVQA